MTGPTGDGTINSQGGRPENREVMPPAIDSQAAEIERRQKTVGLILDNINDILLDPLKANFPGLELLHAPFSISDDDGELTVIPNHMSPDGTTLESLNVRGLVGRNVYFELNLNRTYQIPLTNSTRAKLTGTLDTDIQYIADRVHKVLRPIRTAQEVKGTLPRFAFMSADRNPERGTESAESSSDRLTNMVRDFRETLESVGMQDSDEISVRRDGKLITFSPYYGGHALDISSSETDGTIPEEHIRINGDYLSYDNFIRSFNTNGDGNPSSQELVDAISKAEGLISKLLGPIKTARASIPQIPDYPAKAYRDRDGQIVIEIPGTPSTDGDGSFTPIEYPSPQAIGAEDGYQ